MAIITKKDLKSLDGKALESKLLDIRRELNTERGQAAAGGRASNPGKIRQLRRAVAKILTVLPSKGSATQKSKPAPAPVAPARSAEAKK